VLAELLVDKGLNRFYDPGPLPTEAEVAAFEAEFGHVLPADYRWYLLNEAGCDVSRRVTIRVPHVFDGVCVNGYPSAFRASTPLADIWYQHRRHKVWELDLVDPGEEQPWWRQLLPIHPYRHSLTYCLDFHHDPVNPPVVCVMFESAEGYLSLPPVRFPAWIKYVAPSFTDMVKQMEIDLDFGYDWDRDTYEHAGALLKWRRDFEEYVGRFHRMADNPWSPR